MSPAFVYIFAKYRPILKILSLAHSLENLQQSFITYLTSSELRRYTIL